MSGVFISIGNNRERSAKGKTQTRGKLGEIRRDPVPADDRAKGCEIAQTLIISVAKNFVETGIG